ncbi:MAG: hypothetical protein EOO06_13720 [Chitinophagaceae bacterium]|nr:MAG: hypothetical protein EOO06_13720 [Chitinophagaceae bacterium]
MKCAALTTEPTRVRAIPGFDLVSECIQKAPTGSLPSSATTMLEAKSDAAPLTQNCCGASYDNGLLVELGTIRAP